MRSKIVKELVSVTVILAILSVCSPVFADTPLRKLGRGVANIGTGVLELPINIVAVTEEDGYVAGVTYGIVKGLAWSVLRTMVGVYEVVTFPIPFPQDYEPVLEPEFLLGNQY